ncbi:hypothetical protein [Candidatus Francisella endociliophora]|uniref:hypothetical protein n=1 Tax=Candidatus Francisella endociliophora TaxID=653937 RepID=UPI000693B98E|nr:hypothetical protein [Francisella sp. FSC1006]
MVCKKNTKHLTESDIYYRYSARTEKIKYSELRKLLDDKREKEQKKWMEHIQNIAKIGVENVTLMDVFRGTITHENNKQIVIDNSLLRNMNLIKEGKFVEKDGAPALKLIGEIEGVESYSLNMNLNEDWYTTKELGEKLGLLTKKKSTVYMTAVIWQYNIQEQSKYFQSKKSQKFYSKLCYEYLKEQNISFDKAKDIYKQYNNRFKK